MTRSGDDRQVSASSAGGAAAEAGSGFRAGVAAYIASHILRGEAFADIELPRDQSFPVSMLLEAGVAVDDIVVKLAGGTAYVQAKTRLEFGREADSSLRAAVAQWVKLAADADLDSSRDRLVAAAASASETIRDLRKALRRRRREIAGEPSVAEAAALKNVSAMLSELDPPTRARVLDCAVIWIADLEENDGLAARLGEALLEPGVVIRGQGGRAWTILRETARDLARRRFGATLKDLMTVLADEGLSLTVDGEGYASAQQQERRIKIEAYRARVDERGAVLDLRGLGVPIPPNQACGC